MRLAADRTLIDGLRESAHPFDHTVSSDDALVGMLGQAQLVLLGEASHGTHEFYRERARLSRRLIEEHGFAAVAVEADWPDAYRVNRWVRGEGERQEATDALSGFTRFPTWMWRNADVLDFVGWLRAHNEEHRRGVGFYGLDLYSLFASIDEVIRFLETRSPPLARAARERYACFAHFPDPEQYGRASQEGLSGCEQQVVAQLIELARVRLSARRLDRLLRRGAERAPREERRGLLPHDVPGPRLVVEPARSAHGRDDRRDPRSGSGLPRR